MSGNVKWWSAFAAAVLGAQANAQQAGGVAEEVVVTGSYIRSSSFQTSSPVDTYDRVDINYANHVDIAHFFLDVPYNTSSGSRGSIQDVSRAKALGGGNIGFRGLGESSVLVLLDGHRTTQHPNTADAQIDANSILPQIMIERVEVLKDGASSIYGSDAVAGVVNFIPRNDFVGLEFDARGNWITQNDFGADNWRAAALWGAETDDLNIVFALEAFQQDHQPNNTFKFDRDNYPGNPRNPSATGVGSPGNLVVPIRDAAGVLTGDSNRIPDPDCERNPGSYVLNNTNCAFNFGPNSTAIAGEDRVTTMLNLENAFTDTLTYKGQLNYTRVVYKNVDTPSGNLSVPITIPGHNPGNDFRATAADGNPLFAVPSNVSMGYDKDGDGVDNFLPQRQNGNPLDLSSPVVLTANPTDPATGIPFWEDIGFNGRVIGSQGGLPTNGELDVFAYNDIRPKTRTDQNILRISNGLEAQIYDDWFADFDVTWSEFDMRANVLRNNIFVDALRESLIGFGGDTCDSVLGEPGRNDCRYFNIFGNAPFANPGSVRANTQSIVDFIMPAMWDNYRSRLLTIEAVATGDVLDLPAGPFSIAIGTQYRKNWLELDFDALRNQGRTERGLPESDLDANRDTSAVFAEFQIPVFDNDSGNLLINASIRNEDSGGELTSTDPKIGFVYNTPSGVLSFRGSWGESFLSPSLFRLYSSSVGLELVDDVPQSEGGTGQTLIRVQTVERGDPNLQPQTSEARSFGVTIQPTNNLSFDIAYWDFDFKGLLASESAQQVIFNDPFGSRVVRDPNSNIPLNVTTFFVNASQLSTTGWDIQIDWTRQLQNGALNFNLTGTYVQDYDIQDTADSPVIDGAGKINQLNFGDTSIEWRLNPRLTWQRGDHMVTAVVKYASSLVNNGRRESVNPTIKSWAPLDVMYQYQLRESMALSFGMQNTFDLQPEDEWGGTTNGRFPFGTQTFEGRIAWMGINVSL